MGENQDLRLKLVSCATGQASGLLSASYTVMSQADSMIRQVIERGAQLTADDLHRLACSFGLVHDVLSGLHQAAILAIRAARRQLTPDLADCLPSQDTGGSSAISGIRYLVQALHRVEQEVRRLERRAQDVHDQLLAAASACSSPGAAEDAFSVLMVRIRQDAGRDRA